jgi:hypothetical protein
MVVVMAQGAPRCDHDYLGHLLIAYYIVLTFNTVVNVEPALVLLWDTLLFFVTGLLYSRFIIHCTSYNFLSLQLLITHP